jgi:hypothetical protein
MRRRRSWYADSGVGGWVVFDSEDAILFLFFCFFLEGVWQVAVRCS